jgi:hypothetical protein
MNKNVKGLAGLMFSMLLLLIPTSPIFAHHSFAAQYDSNKPVTMTGMVTKVEWQNPHVYLYIDVEDDNGNYEKWALEMGAPAVLTRIQGWSRSTLNIGDMVSVEGRLARDGSNLANARSVTLTSGAELGAGSSELTTP